MQFHIDGFKAGDPLLHSSVTESVRPLHSSSLPEQVDVLIVGCGPAGLTLAAQLSAFPDITTRIIEQKDGPLTLGQADGIACRTMEMFEAFNFCERVKKEAYWVNEVTFWKPDTNKRNHITRHGRVQDVEDNLSEMPHVILNQARVHDFYLELMRNSANRLEPDYSRELMGIDISNDDSTDYPVTVRVKRTDPDHDGQEEVVKARYVVGCDGARSVVRKSIGRELSGESANQAWGVMDILAVTDFPDIRFKAAVQSADEGNMLVIPREGGYLVRIYVEMDKLKENERVTSRNITLENIIAAAQRILHPYVLDVKEVAWWSVYEIGQRICNSYDDLQEDSIDSRFPRAFIAGDACHTHSPKAGQGMNVSMQDTFNLGWKLASVLRKQCMPDLLNTYSIERQAVAQELIDFDREWAKMFSDKPKENSDSDGVDPKEFQKYFVKQGRFTAGVGTRYRPSIICGEAVYQDLAKGFPVGMRFHSAPVIRLSDARRINLGHTGKADGRWRLYAFSGAANPLSPSSAISGLCEFLANSLIKQFTHCDQDIDAVFDVRAIFQQAHYELDFESIPSLLKPNKGRYGLVDYEKVFCPDL